MQTQIGCNRASRVGDSIKRKHQKMQQDNSFLPIHKRRYSSRVAIKMAIFNPPRLPFQVIIKTKDTVRYIGLCMLRVKSTERVKLTLSGIRGM